MYKVKILVTYTNEAGEIVTKADYCLDLPANCDDKKAGMFARVLFAGLKAYYTKKLYTISVSLFKNEKLGDFTYRVTPVELTAEDLEG